MSFEDTHGSTSIIHPDFMALMQHYIETHATRSRGGAFISIHTPTQARLLQKVPERHHYTVASVKAWGSILVSAENNGNNNVTGDDKALYPNRKLFFRLA
jgi:hypothetical protein